MLRSNLVIRFLGFSGALLLISASAACGGHPLNTQMDCGNGVLDSTEECDASDLGGASCASLGWESGSLGCSASCTYETDLCEGTGPECGNDTLEYGEECDGAETDGVTCESLGFVTGALGCTSQCTFDTSNCSNAGSCGDSTLDPGEECDGDELGGQTCDTLGWESGTLACNETCHYDTADCQGTGPVCGNDVVELGEECDGADHGAATCENLGHSGGALTCEMDCTLDESGCYDELCGNGVVEAAEECDGADLDNTTCADLGWDVGNLACGQNCTFDESQCADILPTCGDDAINTTAEECDGVDLGGVTCVALGWDGGNLACGPNCTFDESQCFMNQPICGDGVINTMMEECDGTDLGGQTCVGLGFDSGTLACSSQCRFDTSGCIGVQPICGNGVVNPPFEQCDGNDLNGESCVGLGFGGGMLGCDVNCTFDTSNCWGGTQVCGDGVINQNWEECDGSAFGGETCLSLGYAGGTLACDANCQHDVSGCTGGPTCSPTGGALGCNMAATGTNVGAPDQVDNWFNCVGWPLTGPEVVYTFTMTSGSFYSNITVDVGGLSADLDLMILSSNGGGCDPALGCVDFSGNSQNNPEHATFQATPGVTYYFVVDGFQDATSSYNISVSCSN